MFFTQTAVFISDTKNKLFLDKIMMVSKNIIELIIIINVMIVHWYNINPLYILVNPICIYNYIYKLCFELHIK